MKIITPWSIQIELTQGCNRDCVFCGTFEVNKHQGKAPKFMSIDTAIELAKQCSEYIPTRRYEFAMHGEPTLHPAHCEIIALFRKCLPKSQLQITTNGYSILKQGISAIDKLFSCGIDFIVLDTYYPERDQLREIAMNSGRTIVDGCSETTPYANHNRKVNNTIFLMDDLGIVSGQNKNRVIVNHAGNSGVKLQEKLPLQKMCTNVFREISVCYDGTVCGCCMDYGREYSCGNIMKTNIEQIWNGPQFKALRIALYNKQRMFSPCSRCNYPGGMRQGLIEKTDMLAATDKKVIQQTVYSSAYTTKCNDLLTEILWED